MNKWRALLVVSVIAGAAASVNPARCFKHRRDRNDGGILQNTDVTQQYLLRAAAAAALDAIVDVIAHAPAAAAVLAHGARAV